MKGAHLREFQEYLILTKGMQQKTVEDYSYWAKEFDVEKLSQDYINEFSQSHKNNSNLRGFLINFFEFAGIQKMFDLPPKKSGRIKRRLIRSISKDEITSLRIYFYEKSILKGLMFDIVYQGALRKKEIREVKINSFRWMEWLQDTSSHCKLIVLGKNDKERVVLIEPKTIEIIFKYFKDKYELNTWDEIKMFANSTAYIFTVEGNQISEDYFYYMIKRGSIRVLGRDIRPHELRHCRASELQEIGVPERDIKNYLGHTSLETTEIYLHKAESESIETISNILNKKESEDVE